MAGKPFKMAWYIQFRELLYSGNSISIYMCSYICVA
jgi:hypothetical protein